MATIVDSKTIGIVQAMRRELMARAMSIDADSDVRAVTVTVKMDKRGLHPRVTMVTIQTSDEDKG